MKYFKSGTQDYTSSKRFSIAKLLRAVSTLLKESYNLESWFGLFDRTPCLVVGD